MPSTSLGTLNIITTLAKSDTTWYDPPLDMVYCGGAGNLAVEIEGKTNPIIYKLAAQGFISDVGKIRRVKSTGTTATLIVGIGAAATATS